MTPQAVELLPRQLEFVSAPEREVLYSGAFGSGKSLAVVTKLVTRVAGRPGAREALVRKTLTSLKATTLKTLLDRDGGCPRLLPEGSYVHNKSEKSIRVIGGGEVVYFGIDDAKASATGGIGSYNLSGVAVDQAEELSTSDWTALRGRIRVKVDGIPNAIYAACNPSHPAHFLAVRFGLDGIHKPARGCRAIATRSADNWFLPADYLADLNSFQGIAYRRYVLGEWCGAEGLVYERWNRGTMAVNRPGPWAQTVVGVDVGFTNPTAFILLRKGETPADGVHVDDEWYARKQTPDLIVEQANRWQDQYRPDHFAVDPSAAMLIETMRQAGINAVAANNDVFGGIQKVSRYVVEEAGRPLLTVAPHCENLIRELESYEWKPGGKDQPVKANDHAADALRYAVVSLDEGGGFFFSGGEECEAVNAPRRVLRLRRAMVNDVDDEDSEIWEDATWR